MRSGRAMIRGIKPKPSRSQRDVLSLHQDHHRNFLTAVDSIAPSTACHRTRRKSSCRFVRAATRILRDASRAQLAKLPFAATQRVAAAGIGPAAYRLSTDCSPTEQSGITVGWGALAPSRKARLKGASIELHPNWCSASRSLAGSQGDEVCRDFIETPCRPPVSIGALRCFKAALSPDPLERRYGLAAQMRFEPTTLR